MASFVDISHCPVCGSSWQGEPIPEKSQYLFGGSKFFGRVIAISSRRQDRTIAYQCPDCHTCWDRDTHKIIDSYDLSSEL